MDDIVEAAMRRWPDVPHCWDWLALDVRGDWYLRDEETQAAGRFPQAKGSAIRHPKLLGFIQRNYLADRAGCWYFQNGPQRVYVALEAAPWVWRVQQVPQGWKLSTHTGRVGAQLGTWTDEQGRLFAHTDIGFGIVHTQDMHAASDAIEAGAWKPGEMAFADMPARFGYVLQPRPAQPS